MDKISVNTFKNIQYHNFSVNMLSVKLFLNKKEQAFSKFLQSQRNKIMHTLNGNRIKTFGIKLFHFNKGNAHFRNKVDQIQIEINKFKPDIISLSEANIFKTDTF